MLADSVIESKEYTVQMRQRGQVTIPQKLRAALLIEEGDMLTLTQVGDAIVLTSKPLRSGEIADRFSYLMNEEGVTLNDLLEDLPAIREEIFNERYGKSSS